MRPAVGGVARLGGVCRGVDPVALEALAVGVAHDPAGALEPAVVVRQVHVAGGGVGVAAAHDVALGAGVGPPAGLGLRHEPGLGQHAVGAEPVALEAVGPVGGVHQPAGVRAAVGVVVAHLPGALDPAALDRGRLGLRCGLGGRGGGRGDACRGDRGGLGGLRRIGRRFGPGGRRGLRRLGRAFALGAGRRRIGGAVRGLLAVGRGGAIGSGGGRLAARVGGGAGLFGAALARRVGRGGGLGLDAGTARRGLFPLVRVRGPAGQRHRRCDQQSNR